MKSEWDRKIEFHKINKKTLRPLILKCKKVLEEEVGHKMTPTQVVRILLLLVRNENKTRMDDEYLEELLYSIEVLEKIK